MVREGEAKAGTFRETNDHVALPRTKGHLEWRISVLLPYGCNPRKCMIFSNRYR